VSSLSYNQLSFEEEVRKGGDYASLGFGTELRYLWSPKLTAVIEGRYSQISYPNNSPLDAATLFALIGVDLSLSRRTAATVRVGESLRTFDQSGEKSSAPYLETTLNYQLARASVLSWSNRFGFEEPPDPNTEVLTFRSTLGVTHVFSPRLRGSLSINAIHRSTKNDLTDLDATENTLDSSLSFYYSLTRKWNFNLSYSYTTVFFEPNDESNYFRNRVFAGFDYLF
jgi:Putative beta-barrel porin 2